MVSCRNANTKTTGRFDARFRKMLQLQYSLLYLNLTKTLESFYLPEACFYLTMKSVLNSFLTLLLFGSMYNNKLIKNPVNNYLFKVNNRNTKKGVKYVQS